MKLGFIFPGQGAQTVGMGKDLYDKYEEIQEVYKKASEILNIDIASLTFNSSEEELSQTKNTQIAILVMSLGILEVLKKSNIKAEFVAGLSLGEYSALAYSEAISFEDIIKIVKKRGELMQELVPEGEWAMASVLGIEENIVEEICKNVRTGFVVPANYNCSGHVVISGDKLGVSTAIQNSRELKAKVIELKTAGPFHTEKLIEASNALKLELDEIDVKTPRHKVIKNIDAKEYSDNDDIKDILAKHVINPVRFSESVQNMINQGVDTFVEIGPGKVLTGFVKRINKEVKSININDVQSLENALLELDK